MAAIPAPALKGTPYRCGYTIGAAPVYFDPASDNYQTGNVHDGRSQVLFWDGHIASFRRGTIPWETADLDRR